MEDNRQDKLDDLATDLDDVKLTVEELKDNPPDHVQKHDLDAILTAVEEATDKADELGDRPKK